MKKSLTIVSIFLGMTATLGIFTACAVEAVDKTEKVDCYTYQRYERDYPLFDASTDTIKRCAELGINI